MISVSLFVLPRRSEAWSSILTLPCQSTSCSFESLSPSASVLSELREAILITTPLILAQNPSPKIQPKQRRAWTKNERTKAASAVHAASIDHLKELVEYLTIVIAVGAQS
jgi:hypothetical protein